MGGQLLNRFDTGFRMGRPSRKQVGTACVGFFRSGQAGWSQTL
jgi:hypothetical protein